MREVTISQVQPWTQPVPRPPFISSSLPSSVVMCACLGRASSRPSSSPPQVDTEKRKGVETARMKCSGVYMPSPRGKGNWNPTHTLSAQASRASFQESTRSSFCPSWTPPLSLPWPMDAPNLNPLCFPPSKARKREIVFSSTAG